MESGVHAVELVYLILLGFVVMFAAAARKLDTPYPIVLVIAGLALSFIPGTPRISLDPEIIFLVILPPLLYSAAWQTSWRDFHYNLVSIAMLAIGLVGFTVVSIGVLAQWLIPDLDWRLGLVLGSVVAPTDAIAATSIARRIGLPRRIVDILEGESLLNDATGLLALEFAIALLVNGQMPTIGQEIGRFLILTIGGIAVGLAVGAIVYQVERMINDGPIEITIGLLTPYAAYLAAEAVHASGVLAVVACGLYLSRRSANFYSANVRLQSWSVWEALEFILNGLIFVLIGLQLPSIMGGLKGYRFTTLMLYGLLFSTTLIAIRLIWVFPGAAMANLIRRRLLGQREKRPAPRLTFILGWTGMRGVVALAAAQSIPLTLSDGSPLPHRDLMIFLTFSVILVTLVLQGLSLAPLVRALGVAGPVGPDCEEKEARRIVIDGGLRYLAESRAQDREELAPVYDDLSHHYRERLLEIDGDRNPDPLVDDHLSLNRRLKFELLRVERQIAVQLRDQGRINDAVLRKLERELDLSEARLTH
jgi:CPA1 family monovalent cation:H+ antiporter